MCMDRVEGDELKLTQEFIAEMLGTRRATVSLAAMILQNDGLIEYNRGHIRIIDRPGWRSSPASAITQRETVSKGFDNMGARYRKTNVQAKLVVEAILGWKGNSRRNNQPIARTGKDHG